MWALVKERWWRRSYNDNDDNEEKRQKETERTSICSETFDARDYPLTHRHHDNDIKLYNKLSKLHLNYLLNNRSEWTNEWIFNLLSFHQIEYFLSFVVIAFILFDGGIVFVLLFGLLYFYFSHFSPPMVNSTHFFFPSLSISFAFARLWRFRWSDFLRCNCSRFCVLVSPVARNIGMNEKWNRSQNQNDAQWIKLNAFK